MAQLSTQHLKRRGGTWHLKLTIPRGIRHLYLSSTGKPRTHIEEALGTTDLGTANRKKHQRIAHWYADFEAKRRGAAGQRPRDIATANEWRGILRAATTEAELEDAREHIADKAHDLADAGEESEREERRERVHAIVQLATAKTTLREAWGKWLASSEHNAATRLKDEQAFRTLMEWLGVADAPPALVTHAKARAYAEWLNTEAQSARGGPLSLATKEGRIAPLRMFWAYLEHHEFTAKESNPWRGHKLTGRRSSTQEHPDRKRPYIDAEMLALANGPELRQSKTVRYTKRILMELYALAFYTGARIGEIANRRIGDVQRIKGGYSLQIGTGKTDESIRTIPIVHPIPVALLTRLIGRRKDAKALLFEGLIPGGPNGSLMWYVGKAMGRYRKKCGLGTATDTHSTRRRFLSELANMADPKRPAREMRQFYVGQKPEGMTGVYVTPTPSGLLTVARAIKYPAKVESAMERALGL